jgi:hypothetical protein
MCVHFTFYLSFSFTCVCVCVAMCASAFYLPPFYSGRGTRGWRRKHLAFLYLRGHGCCLPTRCSVLLSAAVYLAYPLWRRYVTMHAAGALRYCPACTAPPHYTAHALPTYVYIPAAAHTMQHAFVPTSGLFLYSLCGRTAFTAWRTAVDLIRPTFVARLRALSHAACLSAWAAIRMPGGNLCGQPTAAVSEGLHPYACLKRQRRRFLAHARRRRAQRCRI